MTLAWFRGVIGLALLLFIYPLLLLVIGYRQQRRFRRAIVYPLMYFLWASVSADVAYRVESLANRMHIQISADEPSTFLLSALIIVGILAAISNAFRPPLHRRFDPRFLWVSLIISTLGVVVQEIFFPIQTNCHWTPKMLERWEQVQRSPTD